VASFALSFAGFGSAIFPTDGCPRKRLDNTGDFWP
jgi:hypothetical protein